jgi:MFS family permease
VLTICGVVIGAGFIFSYFINDLWSLYMLQGVLVGIGLAGVMVPLTSAVIRWFTNRSGLMNGMVYAGLGFGMAVVPLIAAWLIGFSDPPAWREAYLILGIGILVIMVICAQFLRQAPVQQEPAVAKTRTISRLIANPRNYTFREAMKTRTFWLMGLLFFVDLFNVNVVMVHIVQHAKDMLIQAAAAASILSIVSGVSILGRILSGAMGDRLGIKWTIGRGLFTVLLSFVILIFAKNLWMLYIFAVVFGFGGWSVGAVNSPLVAEYFGFKAHGIILGAITFIGTLGGATGPLVAGYIFDKTQSYTIVFILCAAVAVLGLGTLTLLKKPSTTDARRIEAGL